MREAILSIPAQLKKGLELAAKARVTRPYRNIISTGMGGSALAGEMLSMVRDNVIVHWDYDLPVHCDAEDLVVCTSWSGNTEETISSYEKAHGAGIDTLVIAAGGKLAALATSHNSPLILLPSDPISPRTATGYMVGALFSALGLADQLPTDLDAASVEAEGEDLAEKLGGNMMALYSSYPWRKLTGFWKMAYSETTKRQVIANWFPSGAHNEVVGWEGPYTQSTRFLLLREQGEHTRYAKNFDALLAILAAKGYTVHTVWLSGDTLMQKVFHSYLLALWTGYHVATGLGIDPQATQLLDEFKKMKAS